MTHGPHLGTCSAAVLLLTYAFVHGYVAGPSPPFTLHVPGRADSTPTWS
jgi:hypothetical protein